MTTGQPDRHYEELLNALRSTSGEERQGALDHLAGDPDVDVLLRSMAFVLDSADELIERGASALRQAVGKHLFPSEFVPRGAMSILRPTSQVDKFAFLERGEEVLLQRPNKGTQRFRVLSRSQISPLNIGSAGSTYNPARDETTLNLAIRSPEPFPVAMIQSLPFLLQGDLAGAQIIYRALRTALSRIEVRIDDEPFFADQSQVRNLFEGNQFVGQVTRNEGQLPFDLIEFFLGFSSLLRNFEIKLGQVHDQILEGQSKGRYEGLDSATQIDISLTLTGDALQGVEVTPSYFLLNPIVVENMYEKRSLPVAYQGARDTLEFNINLAESNSEVPVDVLELTTTSSDSPTEVVLTPDFSSASNRSEVVGKFQVIKKAAATSSADSKTVQTSISLDPAHIGKLTGPVHATMLCTNGSAVENLPSGSIYRGLNGDLGRFELTNVVRTTRYHDASISEQKLLNGLLDAYACDINVFADTARLKSLWQFYAERVNASGADLRKFDFGIVKTTLKVTSTIYRLGNLPCYEICIGVDDDQFDTPDELFSYVDILQMVVIRLCPINCTSRFKVEKTRSGEILEWPILIASERLSP